MKTGKLISLLILAVILALLPFVVKSPYLMGIFIMAVVNAILGMTFSIIFSTGSITLGAAGFYVTGAYCSAVLTTVLGLSFWLALPLAAIVTGIIALIVGLIIVRSSVLAFLFLTVVYNLTIISLIGHTELLGGWAGITNIPRPESIPIPFHAPIQFLGKIPYYYLVLFLLLLTIVVFYALYSSRIGRGWRAIKLNPQLAASLGINVFRYRLLAFVVACIFAGLAGSFYASYSTALVPEGFGVFESVFIQIYAILGGLNSYIAGPIVGAFILTWMPELLRISKEIEPIIDGFILVILVVFLPGGILSLPERASRLWTPVVKIARRIRSW